MGGFISNENILKETPKFQTCVCWNNFSRFLKRDGRTKSQPLARKANSPLKSGSLRRDVSLIIIFEKWMFTLQLSSTLLKIVRFNTLSILSGRKVFFSSYLPKKLSSSIVLSQPPETTIHACTDMQLVPKYSLWLPIPAHNFQVRNMNCNGPVAPGR